MKQNYFDFIICGAGASGLLLLKAIREDSFFNGKSILIIEKESKNVNFMNSGLNFCSDIWKNPLKKALNDAHTYCEWLTYKLNKFGYYKTESIKNIEDIVPNPEFIEYLIFDNPIEN